MPETKTAGIEAKDKVKKDSLFMQTCRRFLKEKSAVFGLVVIILYCLIAIFAPLIAPYDPYKLDFNSVLQAPSLAHWCGTDDMGRDVLSRLIYGARYSIMLGISGSLFGMVFGVIFGCLAGYIGKWVETIIMRICDVMMALPGTLLSILISSILGPGFGNTVLALSIGSVPGKIRTLRAQILRERGQEYLEAAQSYNCSSAKIMFSHLLPNVIQPLLVSLTMGVGGTIMAAAGLSYLGLGVQPPTPEWGAMLSAGRTYVTNYPYLITFPGLVIMVFVWCFNLFGDGLRDALDPKLKN